MLSKIKRALLLLPILMHPALPKKLVLVIIIFPKSLDKKRYYLKNYSKPKQNVSKN